MAASDDVLRRVPLQDNQAEQSVLGAILIENNALNVALEVLTDADFYREAHRDIFRAMIGLSEHNQPIDAITLTDALRTAGTLERLGGPMYLAELAESTPTAANTAHYAKIVHEKAVLRSMASTATDIASEAYETPADVEQFCDEAEHRIFAISERRVRPSFTDADTLIKTSTERIEMLYNNRAAVTGVPTGFTELDQLTAGLQPGELIILAARPGMGKTALALNIAANAALNQPHAYGVAFFSLEMSQDQLGIRLLCAEAMLDSSKVRSGFLSQSDFPKIAAAGAKLRQAPIWIDDASDTSPLVLKAKCRRLAQRAELGLVVVDYLQLMLPAGKAERREREVAEMTRSLKALAKELRLPVLALSQLNRQVESRQDRRPMLADLRESGAIEQDADVIAFIYRDDVYNKDSQEPGTAEIIVAKQRNGPTGIAKLTFLSAPTRFANYAAGFDETVEGYL